MLRETERTNESAPTFSFDEQSGKLTVRGVSEFPSEVFKYGGAIEILDMSNNGLTTLPDNLDKLTNLRVAFFSGNKFREVPKQLAACENLQMVGLKSCGIEEFDPGALPVGLKGLILTDNHLTVLPDSIGKLTQLQKLMLTGNKLTSTPSSIAQLTQLELIRLSDNDLDTEPIWLGSLPNLAWYADSGNAYNRATEVPGTTDFLWSDIEFGQKLGESSKNVVFAAQIAGGGKVAIKLFGAGVTTDGSSDNETTAALIAGDHVSLVGTLGKVDGPSGVQGLVMPLIPDNYVILGTPPDMRNLTRDGYQEEVEFDVSVIKNIARSIADALQHLHARGIMHGDVYAHNVLVSSDGDVKLCDFGAASLYDPNSLTGQLREKIDVVGYGHLLEELMDRANNPNDDRLVTLKRLVELCVDPIVRQRPVFSEVIEQLHALDA